MTRSEAGTSRSNGRGFALLWSASTVSMLGDGMRVAALPLLAAAVSDSAAAVSATTVAGSLPWLLFSLVGGALVDRVQRARLLWLTGLCQTAVVGTFAVVILVSPPSLVTLAVFTLLLGCAQVLYLTASNALVPEIVPSAGLESANARMQGSQVIVLQLLGPLAGATVFGFSTAAPFAVDAVTFLVAALLVRPLTRLTTPPQPRSDRVRRSLAKDIGEGVRWLWGHRGLRVLALVLGIATAAVQLGNTMLVLLVTSTLDAPESAFGLVLAAGAVGGFGATLVAARIRAKIGVTATMASSISAIGLSLLACGAGRSVWWLAAAYAVGGFGLVVWNVQSSSLRQRLVPRQFMGRVGGAYRLIGWSGIPVGAAMSGVLGTAFGIRIPFFVAGTVLLASLLLLPLFGNLRENDAQP
ncbi:MFS transporter [Saccharothrix sp. S26]|uniref:MFS transporter n=1 Tax=Saccharothrix sp. S26 TaxID=2907215 RepID=UPI001F33B86F|nr:MFS transporter [Saccharothrix sp. S26]MCE6999253.1 MFS transporter [Saccharothrix sp. S26]